MNITSKPAHSSLAQRIAKVRNCMLVEVSTGISPTDKNLFVSLCQTYESNNVETSDLPNESRESFPHCVSSSSNLAQEVTQSTPSISMSGRSVPLWQRGVGFLVSNRADFGGSYDGDEDDFYDWDKMR